MTRRGLALLGSVTLLGAAVRLTSPARIGLFRDEVQALNIASMPALESMTRFLYSHESHPPLFYYAAHFLSAVTGDMAGSVAWLVLLASVALPPAAWWLGSLSGVRGAGTVAAILVAASVPLAFFSVQLRPYSLVSLSAVLGFSVLLKSFRSDQRRWRALWVALNLCLVYLHHLGIVIVAAQLITAMFTAVTLGEWRARARSWMPYMAVLILGMIPDVVMLVHQASVASYPAKRPVGLVNPLLQLWGLAVAFPGETGVSVVGAGTGLYLALRRQAASTASAFAAPIHALFLIIVLLLALASYRSHFLVAYVFMAVVPLGMVAAGVAVADAAGQRLRWLTALLAEGFVVCMALSIFAFVGTGKSNTDLVAGYVAAEGAMGDLVIIVPGAAGVSFNHYFTGALSQIDFPLVGAVQYYEFNDDFSRVSSMAALEETLDSMSAVCASHRRLWLLTFSGSILPGEPPVVLQRDSLGGQGQADIARANLIRRRAVQMFGRPAERLHPDARAGGVEQFQAELFDRQKTSSPNGERPACGVS
jgi:hypothetical protein